MLLQISMSVQQKTEIVHKPVPTQMEVISVHAAVAIHLIPTIVPALVSSSDSI